MKAFIRKRSYDFNACMLGSLDFRSDQERATQWKFIIKFVRVTLCHSLSRCVPNFVYLCRK